MYIRSLRGKKGEKELLGRAYYPIKLDHLRILAHFAEEERKAFFKRNPDATRFYENRFLASALCQGAAQHYLGQGNGVKDFDIHLFYEQHLERKQLSRSVYSIVIEIPDFGPCKVDFIRTITPPRLVLGCRGDIVALLRRFLEERPTKNARHLATKAVVGLVPNAILNTVVWPKNKREGV